MNTSKRLLLAHAANDALYYNTATWREALYGS